MSVPRFYRLRVAEVRRETVQAVVVRFEVPPELAAEYRYCAGQFLTLRTVLDGEEVRRSYSICTAPQERSLAVAIKRVEGGRFSPWANESLRAGDFLDVMTPQGGFTVPFDSHNRRHYVAFAAGSGITPVLSLTKAALATEPRSRFTLVYGNRHVKTILFCEELAALKDRYLERFALYHVLSRDHQEVELFNGRIDGAKCAAFLDTLIPAAGIDEVFLCGPGTMAEDLGAVLCARGVPRERIRVERFVAPGEPAPARPRRAPSEEDAGPAAEVIVIADGKRRAVRVPYEGESILEAALSAGAELPWACKAAVCCTCRARLLEGRVRMEKNYTLEDSEVARGFVLTCQSHPLTEQVVLSYDER